MTESLRLRSFGREITFAAGVKLERRARGRLRLERAGLVDDLWCERGTAHPLATPLLHGGRGQRH